MLDTIDLFDPQLIRACERGVQNAEKHAGEARATRTRSKVQVRRAIAEARLAEILPDRFEPGDAWHIISHGDIDSLSYLQHALTTVSHFDHVLISTWQPVTSLDHRETAHRSRPG